MTTGEAIRLLTYDHWATSRVLTACETHAAAHEQDIGRLVCHVIAARQVWLHRTTKDAGEVPTAWEQARAAQLAASVTGVKDINQAIQLDENPDGVWIDPVWSGCTKSRISPSWPRSNGRSTVASPWKGGDVYSFICGPIARSRKRSAGTVCMLRRRLSCQSKKARCLARL